MSETPKEFSIGDITFNLFLLLIFSLGFMQPFVLVFGFRLPLTDFIFVLTSGIWFLSIILKKSDFRWHRFFWLLVFYLAAMTASAIFSINPKTSFYKLAGGLYLLTLPVLTFNLIRDEKQLKKAILIWLAGTAISVLIGLLTLILFYVKHDHWLLNFTLFQYGSLPVGNYPRLQSTFLKANMLCNYLCVSLSFLLLSRKFGWFKNLSFYTFLIALMICALFTFSPGLGGIALSLGIWIWISTKDQYRVAARLSFAVGIVLAAFFIAALPIHLKAYTAWRLKPSSRFLTWIDSIGAFYENPIFGNGIGQNTSNLTGKVEYWTDAHNIFLNVAAQEGLFGLAAIVSIVFFLTKRIFPLEFPGTRNDVYRVGFGLAFLCAFVYQGIGGSFEDSRHLWVLIGFLVIYIH